MDELNKTPGTESTVNPSDSTGEQVADLGNGETPELRPPFRSITSKRVVIPADAKRAARRPVPAPAVESAAAVDSAAPSPAPTEPSVPSDETGMAAPEHLSAQGISATAIASAAAVERESPSVAPASQTEPTAEVAPLADAFSTSTEKDERTLVPAALSEQPAEAAASSRGLNSTQTPFLPTEPVPLSQAPALKRHNRILEFALWGIAILLLAATAFFVIPLFFPNLFSNQGAVTNPPTATVQVAIASTRAPSPTTTLLPTDAPTQAANPAVTSAPLIIPTPPPDGLQISLLPDGNLSGWVTDGTANVNYADTSLLAGKSEGKSYTSILQFNLRNLPANTQVLFAVLEMTGRDSSKLSSAGEWQVEFVESPIGTDWSAATPEQIISAKSLGVIGALNAADLGNGQLNRIFFDSTQMQMLSQQFKNGNVVLRIRGPEGEGNNLFAWDSGVGGSALNAPTLHLVAVPGNYVVITNTPPPRNVLTAAVYVVRGTDAAKRNGTPTPFPPGVATATPGGEQVEIPVETAIPQNDATAIARAQLATAIARTTGTYTPTPKGAVLIFPTFTPVVISPNELATATPIPPDANLLEIPIDYDQCNCQGRILLYSNRYGGDKAYPIMVEPDGTELGKLSGDLYYRLAAAREQYSPDRKQRIIYPEDSRRIQQIGIEDVETGEITFLTKFPKGVAYDGAWAPDGSAIVFVGTEADNADQIYLYDIGTQQMSVLIKTPGGQPWFKHPSWSPDSQKIVFWSSVSGLKQIWVMNRDGTNQVNISSNDFNEFDPVWVK